MAFFQDLILSYNIYKDNMLYAVCDDEMDTVMAAVRCYRESDLPVRVEEVYLDGSTSVYDWEKSYRELCNQ